MGRVIAWLQQQQQQQLLLLLQVVITSVVTRLLRASEMRELYSSASSGESDSRDSCRIGWWRGNDG